MKLSLLIVGLSTVALAGCGAVATPAPHSDRCDPAVASAGQDGRSGAAVVVAAPGPDVIDVDLTTDQLHRRLHLQTGKNFVGGQFDFPYTWGDNTITVTTKRLGTCHLAVRRVS